MILEIKPDNVPFDEQKISNVVLETIRSSHGHNGRGVRSVGGVRGDHGHNGRDGRSDRGRGRGRDRSIVDRIHSVHHSVGRSVRDDGKQWPMQPEVKQQKSIFRIS